MGEEKWMRRKPGRASGTVVPPPVGDDPPPLPERRNPGRTRHRLEGSPRGRTQPPVPEMPDNVRLLFQPVLRPSEGGKWDEAKHPVVTRFGEIFLKLEKEGRLGKRAP